jgi:uncharacterized membrane protein YfcA
MLGSTGARSNIAPASGIARHPARRRCILQDVSPIEAAAVLAAGFAAGTLNAVVGSGSLLTFPTLLAIGLPPVTANVSNTIGLVFGGISGTLGYRRELAGQRDRVIRLGIAGLLGGTVGAALLLVLPAAAFRQVVPFLVLFAAAITAIQPALTQRLEHIRSRPAHDNPLVVLAVFLTAIYGGYFGAAQGVILLALLLVLVNDDPQRLNGLKNALILGVNAIAALIFALVAPVDWTAVLLLALGSIVGGQLGATVGRRLSPGALRLAVVVLGTVVGLRLLLLP